MNSYLKSSISCGKSGGGCCCRPMPKITAAPTTIPNPGYPEYYIPTTRSMGPNDPLLYNVPEVKYREMSSYLNSGISCGKTDGGCCCRPMPNMNTAPTTIPNLGYPEYYIPTTRSMGANDPLLYNVAEVKSNKYCWEITHDKDCKCKESNSYLNSGISCGKNGGGCCCRPMPNMNTAPTTIPNLGPSEYIPTTRSMGANNQLVYNITEVKSNKFCSESTEDKDCKCSPIKPPPPCHTFDCDCLQETLNINSRKKHKPYCPLFKHKSACPVNTMFDDELKVEEDEDEVEPLPYGLPPIKLGPCPVMGRPCSVPDGFARMYRTAALARVPPSHAETGKVCCSKEFERIKTALKEYIIGGKENDLRCVNAFNIDTERRCCDKEQVLLALMGKTCCGTHKLAIRDKFKKK